MKGEGLHVSQGNKIKAQTVALRFRPAGSDQFRWTCPVFWGIQLGLHVRRKLGNTINGILAKLKMALNQTGAVNFDAPGGL